MEGDSTGSRGAKPKMGAKRRFKKLPHAPRRYSFDSAYSSININIMKADIRKIKKFYDTDLGRHAHRSIAEVLSKAIKLPDQKPLCITSHGGYFYEDILRQSFSTLARHTSDDDKDDVHHLCWPTTSATADCVVMIHDIEFSKMPDNHIAEAWRVLKDSGQLIILFPNRGGAWAAKDNNPFGYGTPQTMGQMKNLLENKRFKIIEMDGMLFYPPQKPKVSAWRAFVEKSSGVCGFYKPGLMMIQAVKKMDKGKAIPTLSNIAENVGRALQPKPVINPNQSRSIK